MSERSRRHDAKRREAQPWRLWYKGQRWKRKRRAQLKAEPSCRRHRQELGAVVPATIVDHVEPHRGDWIKFWNGELQSLCKPCHDRHKQREELEGFARGTDVEGWPVDPRHPFARS